MLKCYLETLELVILFVDSLYPIIELSVINTAAEVKAKRKKKLKKKKKSGVKEKLIGVWMYMRRMGVWMLSLSDNSENQAQYTDFLEEGRKRLSEVGKGWGQERIV